MTKLFLVRLLTGQGPGQDDREAGDEVRQRHADRHALLRVEHRQVVRVERVGAAAQGGEAGQPALQDHARRADESQQPAPRHEHTSLAAKVSPHTSLAAKVP